MPALTHGRVVNGFNAYPRIFKKKENNIKHNSNCNKKKCMPKYSYKNTGTIIPEKYINSNSCSSQKCRRVLSKDYPKSTLMKYNISQRGIGDSLNRNILNRKTRNEASLAFKLNKKRCDCYSFKLF